MMKKARFFHVVFPIVCALVLLILLAGRPGQVVVAESLSAIDEVLLSQDFNGSTSDLLVAGWSVAVKRPDGACPTSNILDAGDTTFGGIDCGYHTPGLANDRALGYYQTSRRNTASIHLKFYNTFGAITDISGSFDLESAWSQYDSGTARFAQFRGKEQGNEVALSYAVGVGNVRGTALTPNQITQLSNVQVSGTLAQTWLSDEQMNTLGLSQREIAFNLGTVQLNVCDTLELTWHGDDNQVDEQEMQVNLDNFVLSGAVTHIPASLVQVDAAWVGKNTCDVINLNGAKYYYGYDAFATLQAGIDAVASGGTVVIRAGNYDENVNISKPLTLSGSGSMVSNLSLAATIDFSGVSAHTVTVQPGGSIQNGNDIVATNGTVTVQAGNYAGPLTIGVPQTVQASGPVTLTAGSGPAITSNAGGNVTIKGLSIQTTGTVFQQSTGNLNAYANNILPGFTSAYHGSGGTFVGAHNWWGSNDPNTPQPAGLSVADWQTRLGAQVKHWQDGSNSATLVDSRNAEVASLSGGVGTVVIVSHGRADNPGKAPFGNNINGRANTMCSDFYDFFVLPGSTGNWQVNIPVDNTANCNADARDAKIAYFVPVTSTYSTACSPASNPNCWQPIDAANISSSGQVLRISNLSSATLGGTPFVAGSGQSSPTAIHLLRLRALPREGNVTHSNLIGFTLLLTGMAMLWVRRSVCRNTP